MGRLLFDIGKVMQNLAIYVCQELILVRIHVEVSVRSFRGQF